MRIKVSELRSIINEALRTRVLKEPKKKAEEPAIAAEPETSSVPESPIEDPNSASATLPVPTKWEAGEGARLYSGSPKVEWVPLYDAPCGNIIRWARSGSSVKIAGRPGSRNVKVSYMGTIFYARISSLRSSVK